MRASIGLPIRPPSWMRPGEDLAAFGAPAELGDETVLDVAFFVGARAAVGVRPGELPWGVAGLAERA
ncbi:MAG: hypothetical protein M3M96_09095 [Candidatus Eremiobacteraeota bacterium]|nr:hypothetical protein [Candidatus Eremiobacteraeota bacterium]